jgi:hypothetical protein
LFAFFCSTSLFAQKELDPWDFVGSWTYPECLNVFVFYPENNILKIKLVEKYTGYTADMSILSVKKDSLITELYTPKNNWYVRKVFYIENNILIAKTTGNSNKTEYYKKI